MRLFALFSVLFCAMVQLGQAQVAPSSSWVQVEAHPDLRTAQDRARAYGTAFPNVSGFRLNSGWYAVALGPYATEDQARFRLLELRRGGLIPSDSYISDARPYGQQFWPVGGARPATPLPPTPQTPAVQIPDETPQQARRSEQLLSRDERMELQEQLQWFGFYTSAIDGSFGRGTRNSMASWQTANAFEATGILTTQQRATLAAAYRDALAELGLKEVTELRAGIQLTMPGRLVQFEKYDFPFVHYAPKDDSGIRVLLISQEGGSGTLAGLYNIMQTLEIVPLEGERSRNSNSFTLTGQNAEIHSYSYARVENGTVKGFTLAYPPEKADAMSRVIPIMLDSFTVLDGTLTPDETDEAAQSVDLLAGLELRRPKQSRSGFYVDGSGAVLTYSDLVSSCERVTIDEIYEADVTAVGNGLALLTPQSALVPLDFARFSTSQGRLRQEVALAGYSFEGALNGPSITYGTLEDLRDLAGDARMKRLGIEALSGDAGGPILSDTGAVLGILMPPPETGRALPDNVQFAMKASELATFLSENGRTASAIEDAATLAPETLARRASDMTVLVSCW